MPLTRQNALPGSRASRRQRARLAPPGVGPLCCPAIWRSSFTTLARSASADRAAAAVALGFASAISFAAAQSHTRAATRNAVAASRLWRLASLSGLAAGGAGAVTRPA
jgi:hypothetical protein